MSNELLYEVKDRVAYLTLNRLEKRNAISPAMLMKFHSCLDLIDADPEVRAVCVTGAGEKAFCAGADLGGGMMNEDGADSLPRQYASLLGRLAGFGKPVVARVAGPCLAGGTGLMMACHIVIARDDVFFQLPEVNVGLFPFMVGALLNRNVLLKKALEMSLTGRKVPPAEAEAMGMITFAVPADQFENRVEDTLKHLANASPSGMRMGLEAFYRMAEMPLDEALPFLSGKLIEAAATEDAKEGVTAFLEKRKPNFSGH